MLSLHVTAQDNTLDKIVCYEPINPETLDKLIHSTLLQLVPNKHVTTVHANEKVQLLKYQQLINDDDMAVVKYNRSMKYGRSNPNYCLGLFMIRREIRHTLAGDSFVDIDIDNAHPSMLCQICESNDIKCDILKSYIEDRQMWFDLVVKHWNIADCDKVKENSSNLKDIPKNLFIRLMYSGGHKKWVDDWGLDKNIPVHSKIQMFLDEVKSIAECIGNANPELYEIARMNKYVKAKKEIKEIAKKKGLVPDLKNIKPVNVYGTCCSYVMQEYESRLLEAMYNFLIYKNCIQNNKCVLCADGIMIEKHNYYNNMLSEMEDYLYDVTKFRLKLSTKAMNKGYNKILDDHLPPNYVYQSNNTIKINSQYLLNSNDDNNGMKENLDNFFQSDTKILNVKSAYGTGKTTMLKDILNKYCVDDNKRILYLSYRKTLSMDLHKTFKYYGFNSYKEYKDNRTLREQDRLIIQVESLYRLEDQMINDFLDVRYVPQFDIIIIDETESVLNQYQSTHTFKDKARETFELMISMCKACTKIIALDGDMGTRSYQFLQNFGKSMNIVNTYKVTSKSFQLMHNIIHFREKLLSDIGRGEKVVFVSMSSSLCEDLVQRIKEEFPNKKVKMYTSSTDDLIKIEDFENVNKVWNTLDFLCYSPTIEAGVDFNVPHFTKMYANICTMSCSPRSFMQMIARIRHIDDSNVITLNESLPLLKDERISFNEMVYALHGTFNMDAYTRQEVFIDGRYAIKTVLMPYNINYIHNMMEKQNSNHLSFMAELNKLCLLKGHSIDMIEDKKLETEKVSSIDHILSVSDIDTATFEVLRQKQLDDKATMTDKYQIHKYTLQKQFGIKTLSKKLINNIPAHLLKNYIYLSDNRNIPLNTSRDMTVEKTIIKVTKIRELIKHLGFNDIYSDIVIDKKTWDQNLKTCNKRTEIFNNIKDTKILFGIDDRNHKKPFQTTKKTMAYLNNLLNQYSINIKSTQKGKHKIPHYTLERKNNIDEIMVYKKLSGHNIHIKPDSIKSFKYDIDISQLEKKLKQSILEFNTLKGLKNL